MSGLTKNIMRRRKLGGGDEAFSRGNEGRGFPDMRREGAPVIFFASLSGQDGCGAADINNHNYIENVCQGITEKIRVVTTDLSFLQTVCC
jgi:hypothetical protein